jgi:hypothetical protein
LGLKTYSPRKTKNSIKSVAYIFLALKARFDERLLERPIDCRFNGFGRKKPASPAGEAGQVIERSFSVPGNQQWTGYPSRSGPPIAGAIPR